MTTIRFESRDITPWTQHPRAADLVVGNIYFRVQFQDQDMVVPQLFAWIFLGRDLHTDCPGLFFQDTDSYFSGVRFVVADLPSMATSPDTMIVSWERDGAWLECEPPREFARVQEYDQALDSLLLCSIRRRTWDRRLRPAGPTE